MVMTSQGAICAAMMTSTKTLRPRKRIRAIAKDASVAITSEITTARTVTMKLLAVYVQNFGTLTAVLKCSRVASNGTNTGVLLMMSFDGLKAVLIIQ